MSMKPRSRNPYIGPRAFQDGETLYGRDREVSKLLNLLIAERIVLLYSPSGAGKTSLIQAALIPELRAEGFRVFPVIRVGMEPPPDRDLPATTNRYLLSTLLSLEEELPPDQQISLSELVGIDVTTYLNQRLADDGEADGDVLIFDQFEEILTVDPTDQTAKAEFFVQLGQALRPRNRWVLFAMREEYSAGLDPYVHPIPTRFSTTFRLELLGVKAARQAMQEPARQAGVPFQDAAAVKLLDDLRRVQVQQPDSSTAERPGTSIEPVQLQVVCYRLWDNLPDDATEIRETDIREAGDVDSALAGYYADRVQVIADRTSVRERTIREWFDRQLITEQGIRGQVLRGPDRSQGLENQAIEPLVDAHLVRAENRRGGTWYELTHDRLIKPVKESNAAWRKEHLSMLQHQAVLWDSQGRSNGLLLRNEALEEAEYWAADHQDELISIERDFLAACQEARTIAERERRQARRIRWLGVISTIIGVIAVIASAVAYYQQVETEKAKIETAVEQERNTQLILNAFELQLARASMLARMDKYAEARNVLNESRKLDNSVSADRRHARNVLAWFTDLMGGTPSRIYRGLEEPLLRVAVNPKYQLLAAVGEKGVVALFDRNNGTLIKHLSGHTTHVQGVVFHPDGDWLATGGHDQQIIVWSLPDGQILRQWSAAGKVYILALSPDGKILASGGSDKNITLWNPLTGEQLQVLNGHHDDIHGLAFSSDGNLLASASKDRTAMIWQLQGESLRYNATVKHVLTAHTGPLNDVIFHPDGQILATSSDDKSIRLWEVALGNPIRVLLGHTNEVNGLVFVQSGDHLVSGSRDRTLRVWDTMTGVTLRVLQGHTGLVARITAHAETVFSASSDGTLMRWDVEQEKIQQGMRILNVPVNPVAVAIAPDGFSVAVGFLDGTLRLYTLPEGKVIKQSIATNAKTVYNLAFSPDGKYLVGSFDNGVTLWQITNGHLHTPRTFKTSRDISSVTFSPDNKYFAFSGYDGRIGIVALDLAKGYLYEAHQGTVHSVNFENGTQYQYLLSTGSDGKTRLWKLHDRRLSPADIDFPDTTSDVLWGVFSPDGSHIATVGRDLVVHVLRVNDGSEEQTLEGHEDLILRAAFSPDGRQVATISSDVTVRFWDISLGTELFVLRLPVNPGRSSPVWDFDFRCITPSTANGECWLAIPLIGGKLMLYNLGQSYN